MAKYDLLVAADGRHPKTRRLYQAHDSSFKTFMRLGSKDYVGFNGNFLPGRPPSRASQ